MPSRTSLDSRFSRVTSPSVPYTSKFGASETMEEEEQFEDVGLDNEDKLPPNPRKKGLFSRFGDLTGSSDTESKSNVSSSYRGFHLPGRKRGQSGAGAELGAIKPSIEPGNGS